MSSRNGTYISQPGGIRKGTYISQPGNQRKGTYISQPGGQRNATYISQPGVQRNATYISQPGGKTVERQVINTNFSYNPLVEPPGYSNNTQSMTQGQNQMTQGQIFQTQGQTQMTQYPQQYIPQQRQQYQPADRNYFEQNLIQINDQMQNVNSYNQQAVNHNQMLLEMQENKLNSLMNEVKKIKDTGGNPSSGAVFGGRGLDKDKDLENLMMLNAFDDSLANNRMYYGDQLFNKYGRNAKANISNQLLNQNASNSNKQQPYGHRRNFSQPTLLNPQQNYRNDVFGGFGELFWDNRQNNQHSRLQSPSIPYDNQSMEQPMSSRGIGGGGYNPPPQYQPQQSVFQRNSSSILHLPPQQYQDYNRPHQSNSFYTPRTPYIQQQPVFKKSIYETPNPNQNSQKSTAYSTNAMDNTPIDDPLTNLLVKQGNLMEAISSNIEKETKKQEKQDIRLLKKKLDKFEEQQKQMQLQDEYQINQGKKYPPNPYEQRNDFDPMNPYKNYDPNNPYKLGMYDPFGSFNMPLQLILAMNKNNGESKSNKVEMIKMQMLMRKMAIENELLRNNKKRSSKSKGKKSRRKSKKPKRVSIAGDDEEDYEDDYDDQDDYYDDDDEDEYYDSDEYYDDEDEEQDGPPQPPQETEEERKKREEEEQKKAKEIRIKELFKRLRLVKTRAMFPIMYFNTIRYQIQEKKALTYKKMNEDLSTLFDNVTQWVQKVCSRGLVLVIIFIFLLILFTLIQYISKIQDTKASCDITKKLSDKEMRKRVDNVKLRVKAFLDGLADNCKEEDLGNVAISIFGNLTNSFNFPPQQFLYKFEINRLKYTYYGALKYIKIFKL